jgi:hypothetical protein
MGLSFLAPLFLAGAVAASIPILIHLFHRRTEPVIEFAAMRFLRRAPVEQSRRRRIRELILLALRVTALLLLAFAFARPYLGQSAAAVSAPVTIVLIDTSASLTAPGQFERAQALAQQAIGGAGATHAVGVVTFANAADVVAPPSQDRAGALAAIARLKPGAGATRYRTALARAAEALGDRPGRFVVITDLQQTGWDAADEGAVPDRVTVDVQEIASPAGNVALTSLRVDGTDAVALVQNFSARTRTEQVGFAIDGRRVGVAPVTIAPRGTAEARISVEGRNSGALSATVSDRDGYAADNTRFAVLDAAPTPSVLAISASGQPADVFYLERAVMVAEGASGFRFRSISGPAFSNLTPDGLRDVDVLLVLGTRGLEHRGRELLGGYLRGGGGVLLAAGPDVDAQVLRQAFEGVLPVTIRAREATASRQTSGQTPLRFAPADSRHPVFRLFGGVGTLANVSFDRAAGIDVPSGAEIIARYSDGTPALVEHQMPSGGTGSTGRVLVFASDLNNRWNDFPLQPAFVPFVHEALRYLAAARAPRSDYLVGDLPAPLGSVPGVVGMPAPGGAAAPSTSLRASASTSLRAGPSTSLRASRRVAVNVDPRESDPARITADAFRNGVSRMNVAAAQQARAQAREREETQRLWQFGLLLMIVSLAAEGMLGKRLA